MHTDQVVRNGVTEIFLSGKIIHPHNEELISIAEEFIKSNNHTLVINFKDVSFIDSAELGALLLIRLRIVEQEKSLILREPSDFIKNVFEGYQFEKVFTIE